MTTNRIILLIVLGCLIVAGGIYAFAYMRNDLSTTTTLPPAGRAKVAAGDISDGTYVVRIRSIMTTPEDTVITFTHVTYFEGDEAMLSAKSEAKCPDENPIEACVPTLTRGYYVRESGAEAFSAPVNSRTVISLKDNSSADIAALNTIKRQFDPVFEVEIRDGNVVSLVERSPL